MKATLLLTLLLATPAFGQPLDLTTRPLRHERSRTFDVLHYRIELHLDEDARAFRGRTTVTLTPLREVLTTVDLDAETFTVTAVTDDTGQALPFTQGDGRLSLTLAHPYAFDDTLSVRIDYAAEHVDVDPARYGMAEDYDLGLDFKPETERHPRLINTLSFPEGARHWFPCYDHPNDRATQETIVTVRSDYRVLSNGRLVSVTSDAGTKTYHWSLERPHATYLAVLVAGPYEVLADSLGSLPLHYWVYPSDVDDAPRSFYKTPEILSFFEETYGVPFPWVKYDQVTIPGIGGGAESTSATVLGESTIHDARADADFPSHWLIAHEAAHQWWGNLVSYRDWSETWLSESFATYSEYLFSRHDLGEDEGALNLRNKQNAYLDEARTRYRRPIVFYRWRYPNDNFDRHTYQKGAAVLHMLRFVLGDAAFFRTLRLFLRENAYRPVDTHDFMKAVKEATGQNLDWFFEQWIYRPGHPKFDVASTWDEATHRLTLTVEQVQDTTDGTPIYRTPVRVRLVTPTEDRVETVLLSQREDAFNFSLPGRPLMVRFDEGNFLLKEWTFPKPVAELLYQLLHDDALGRMWAASQLTPTPEDVRIETALRQAARTDPFWAVRRAALQALDRAGVRRAFVLMLEEDPHPRVREAALEILSREGAPDLLPYFRAVYERDESYVVQAAALRAIGAVGTTADLPFLEEAARVSSPRNLLANAAREAIAQINR